MPLNMQRELFSTILLQNFRNLFPLGKLDRIDVPLSISEDIGLVKSYLDLISISLVNNNTLAILFCKYEGIEILKKLAVFEDEEVSIRSITIIDLLCWLPISSLKDIQKTLVKGKGLDEKLKLCFKDISRKAVVTSFQVAHWQSDYYLEYDSLGFATHMSFLESCGNILDLFYEKSMFDIELDSTITVKFEKMLFLLLDKMSSTTKDELLLDWALFLNWVKVLLPLQLVGKVSNT